MKRFSQRIGAAEVPTAIQLEGISDALRNSIWNYIHALFDEGDSGWWGIAENSAQFFFSNRSPRPDGEERIMNHAVSYAGTSEGALPCPHA